MEVNVTATGTPNVFNVTVAQSGSGGQGPKGDKGWSPMIRTAEDGNRQVLELYDWTGGQGTKPTTVGYLSPTGLTADIAEATNIKGDSGGIGSVNWGQVGGLLSDQADLWSELGGKATPQDIVDALNGLELGSAAFTDASDYATSTQGEKADSALQSFTEADPTVPAHVKAISETDISTWDGKAAPSDIEAAITGLDLGTASKSEATDFATAAQGAKADSALQSFTESDPTVPSHVKAIESTDITAWNNKATSSDIANAISSLNLGTAATQDTGDFATSSQGAKADTALQPESEWFGTLSQYTALPSDKLTNGVEHFIEADPQP